MVVDLFLLTKFPFCFSMIRPLLRVTVMDIDFRRPTKPRVIRFFSHVRNATTTNTYVKKRVTDEIVRMSTREWITSTNPPRPRWQITLLAPEIGFPSLSWSPNKFGQFLVIFVLFFTILIYQFYTPTVYYRYNDQLIYF